MKTDKTNLKKEMKDSRNEHGINDEMRPPTICSGKEKRN